MTAQEYIVKVNFMVNVGTDFDYKGVYKTLSEEDKVTVDKYFQENKFISIF